MTDRATVKKSPKRGATSPKVLPTISIGSDIREVVSFAEEVLAQSGEIFRHRGGLAHLVSSEDSPAILRARPERLREVLASGAEWLLKDEAVLPPAWVVEALMARGSWPSISSLEAVIEYPVLRPDGSLLSGPGYNALARVFYQPNAEFPPLPPLDQEAALDAAARLGGAIDDVGFEAATDRAAFIGALLTIFARHAFEGPAPILLLEGRPGVGKTLLAEFAHAVATGHPGRLPSPPSACGPVALYDNFEGPISTAWADSLLGAGQLVIVAGENLEIDPGAARRCIRCRLHSPALRPDRRGGFEYEHLIDWVLHERPDLVQAALVVLAWYIESDEPDQGLEPWSGFEGWSLLRAAMVWAGLEDPALSNEILRIEVDQVDELRVNVVFDGFVELEKAHHQPPSIAEALEIYSICQDLLPDFGEALAGLCGDLHDRFPAPKEIEKCFRGLRGRLVNGRTLECVGDSPRGPLWTVTGERLR